MVAEDFELTTSLYRHDFQRAWLKLNGFAALSGVDIHDALRDPTIRDIDLLSISCVERAIGRAMKPRDCELGPMTASTFHKGFNHSSAIQPIGRRFGIP